MNFLRQLPPLIEKEEVKVIENVKSYLKIDSICQEFHKLDFNNLLNIKEGSHILDNLSVEHGKSFKTFVQFANTKTCLKIEIYSDY